MPLGIILKRQIFALTVVFLQDDFTSSGRLKSFSKIVKIQTHSKNIEKFFSWLNPPWSRRSRFFFQQILKIRCTISFNHFIEFETLNDEM